MVAPKVYLARTLAKLNALFGRGQVVSVSVILLVGLAASLAFLVFMNSAAPNTITITGGPSGSIFQKNAEKYRKILAREGVTLKILPSEGSVDNFRKLSDPKVKVDVGFVLGGEAQGTVPDNLVSLGSVSYQPLMIFYRGKPKGLLSDFKGQRLDIGQEGSGTHSLALTLLKANGFTPDDGTTYVDTRAGDEVRALVENRIDAIFLMGDSTSTILMRQLLHTPDVHLFSFTQADGYTRRISYLNKLELPKGSLDFGKDIPTEDVYLIGPTVELVARKDLHPALSDLLLEAAREVHGTAGIFKKRGEFPSAVEHEFPISPDARRYYTSGKSFLYRTFPFWVAGLVARALAAIVPIALLLIPALKIAPTVYRWRIESRIYRWYRVLLELERDAFEPSFDPERCEELLRHLDHIEETVNKIDVPASFGDLFYGLRGHIRFVRERLLSRNSNTPRESGLAASDRGCTS
ncbi:MAG: TAXI family TRAP transporter solute-binding subunit [Sulfuricella sp.]